MSTWCNDVLDEAESCPAPTGSLLNDVACFSKFHSGEAWINSCRANLINSGRYALVVRMFSMIYIKQIEMENNSVENFAASCINPEVIQEKWDNNTDECDL